MTYSKGNEKKNQSSVAKLLRVPIRAVVGVGDLCVKSLTANIAFGNTMGCPTPHTPSPKTPSAAVNSPSPTNHKPAAAQLCRSKSTQPPVGAGGKVAPVRHSNASVGIIERIDEDEEV